MEITTDQLPTECTVCRDDAGNIVLADCPNRCDDGLIHDTDQTVEPANVTDHAGRLVAEHRARYVEGRTHAALDQDYGDAMAIGEARSTAAYMFEESYESSAVYWLGYADELAGSDR